MKTRGARIGALSVAGLLGLTTACGGAGAESGGGGKEITFMTWASYADEDILPGFEEKYPDVDVTIEYVPPGDTFDQRLRTLAVQGELPDVIGASPQMLPLIEEDKLLDLTEALKTPAFDSDTPWGETFEPTLLERVESKIPEDLRPDGQRWAVPFGAIALAVVYNEKIFDEVGISPPTNWSEFASNNQALKDAGYTPMSLTGELWAEWWPRLMWDQTARDVTQDELLNGEVSFSDPRLVEGVALIQEMYQSGVFPEGGISQGIEESQALFVQGEMAQFLTVPENFVQYLVENSPFETGAYVLPGAKDVEPVRTLGGDTFMIGVSANSDNQEAAIAFAKYVTSNTAYDAMADHFVIAPTKDWKPEGTAEIMDVFGQAAANGYIPVRPASGVGLDPELQNRIQTELIPALYTGDVTPTQFLEQLRDVYAQEHPKVK